MSTAEDETPGTVAECGSLCHCTDKHTHEAALQRDVLDSCIPVGSLYLHSHLSLDARAASRQHQPCQTGKPGMTESLPYRIQAQHQVT